LNFINQETTKNALKENTQDLINRGGFGSPTYFFEDSMFFGNDRIQLLEEQLKIS
jgi:2-hydroxychromene-2-carboxylate isomerase